MKTMTAKWMIKVLYSFGPSKLIEQTVKARSKQEAEAKASALVAGKCLGFCVEQVKSEANETRRNSMTLNKNIARGTQTFLNSPEDCQWLRDTHMATKNWNNENPIPDFKSFCIFGNEDCPREILLYRDASPNVSDKPVRAMLMDNGCYSFFKV